MSRRTAQGLVMPVSINAANYFKAVKAFKAYQYYKLAQAALDEDTRSGALFKLGLKVTMEAAKKSLGSTLTWHPYYTFHKAHFEALSQALNAVEMKSLATEAFNRAVAAADATSGVHQAVEQLTHRRNAQGWFWAWNLAELMALQNRVRRKDPSVTGEITRMGLTPQALDTTIGNYLYEWQATWAELAMDAITLLLMIDAEARIAEEAMKRYNAKIKNLKEGGSSIGRVAGFAAERDRMWLQFDRMKETGSKRKSEQAVSDPAAHARKQLQVADQAARRLANACDIVFSDAVYQPESLLQKIDAAMAS